MLNQLDTLNLHTLLWSNDAPEDTEASLITDTRYKIKSRIQICDGLIDQLISTKVELENTDETYKRILAKARCVPNDVLHEIFVYCLPDSHEDWPTSLDIINTCTMPLVLASVCCRWRHVALGTPRLWSKFSLENILPENLERYEYALPLWLYRSKNRPLIIHVHVPTLEHHDTYENPDDYSEQRQGSICMGFILHHLAIHCRRWKEMKLSMDPSFLQHFRYLTVDTPVLESFSFEEENQGDYDQSIGVVGEWTGRIKFLQNSSRLVKFSILAMTRIACPDIPLHQLTWLVLEQFGGDTDELVDILSGCPRLETATLSLTKQNRSSPTPYLTLPAVFLPLLTTLEIETRLCPQFSPYGTSYESPEGVELRELLYSLVLPKLLRLAIYSFTPYEEVLPYVLNLVRESSCSLTSLRLCGIPVTRHLLELCPDLKELVVQNGSLWLWDEELCGDCPFVCRHTLVEMIATGYGRDVLCPRLESVCLDYHSQDRDLVDLFVKSRTQDVPEGVEVARLVDATMRENKRDIGMRQDGYSYLVMG